MAVNVGSAKGYLDLDITQFRASLETAQQLAVSKFSNIETQTGKTVTAIGNKMSSVGTAMTKYITAPVVGLGAAAVKVTADFDSAMSRVQATSGATGSELDKLRDKAIEMGAKTKYSASESADAFYYMALAGWDTSEMLDGISGIMDLAAASGEDLAHVSDIVTDGLTAFGMAADESSHFADVLATTMSSANTDVAGLGEAFKYVGPVAGAFGYTIEDVSLALGLMANAGIKSSSMGTALRQALVQLTSPSETAAAYMEKFGISLYTAEGNVKPLRQVMEDLRGTFSMTVGDVSELQAAMEQCGDDVNAQQAVWNEYAASLNLPASEQEKLTALTEIFGARAMPAMLAVIQAGEDDFNSLADAIDNSSGSAQRMTDIMLDNLTGQLTILKSTLETLAIQIGDILMPYIRQFTEWLQSLVEKLRDMSEEDKRAIVQKALFAAAIGPVILVLGKLITAIGNTITWIGKIPFALASAKAGFASFQTAMTGFTTSFSFFARGMQGPLQSTSVLGASLGTLVHKLKAVPAPIYAIIAVIGVLVAAFKHLWDSNEEFRNSIGSIFDGLAEKFGAFEQKILEILSGFGLNFSSLLEALGAAWDGFCNLLAPIFEGAFSIIASILGAALDVLTGILDVFIGLFTGNWEQMGNGLQTIFGGIWDGILGIFQSFADTFIGIADFFLGAFGTSWSELFGEGGGLGETFNNFWTGIQEFFAPVGEWWNSYVTPIFTSFGEMWNTIWSTIGQVFMDAWNALMEFAGPLFEQLSQIWDSLWSLIQAAFDAVWPAVQSALQAGLEFIQGLWNAVWPVVQSVFETTWNAISTVFSAVWDVMKTVVETVLGAIQNVINIISAAIRGDWEGVWNGIKSFFEGIWNGLKSIVDTVINAISGVISSVISGVQSTWESVWGAISGFFSGIWDAMKGAWDTASSWISSIPDNIKNFFTGAGEWLWNAGKAILDGLLGGLKAAWDTVAGWVSNIGGWIKSLKGPLDYDKKLLIPEGLAIMGGLGNGLNSGFSDVEDDVSKMGGKLQSAFGDPDLSAQINVDKNVNTAQNIVGNMASETERFNNNLSSLTALLPDFVAGFAPILNMFIGLNQSIAMLKAQASTVSAMGVSMGLPANVTGKNRTLSDEDIKALTIALNDSFRNAPIENNAEIYMSNSGVYLDNEQVGYQLEPIISRIVTQRTRANF